MLEYDSHELKPTLRKLISRYSSHDCLKDSIHLYQGIETLLKEKETINEELKKERQKSERSEANLTRLEKRSP